MNYYARLEPGRIGFDSPEARQKFLDFSKKHTGALISMELVYPESIKQRKFFEGAVLPMIAFYQEGMDHRVPNDLRQIREWLKLEFNPEVVILAGKQKVIAGTTKGKLNKGFLEDVIGWMSDQGYKVEHLNPNAYEHWRDAIFSFGGPGDPDNYVDYLVQIKKLP